MQFLSYTNNSDHKQFLVASDVMDNILLV